MIKKEDCIHKIITSKQSFLYLWCLHKYDNDFDWQTPH